MVVDDRFSAFSRVRRGGAVCGYILGPCPAWAACNLSGHHSGTSYDRRVLTTLGWGTFLHLTRIDASPMNYALVTQPIFYFAGDESYRNYLSPA